MNGPGEGHVPLREPQVHSHVLDGLPDGHPLASTRVRCDGCESLLHLASNGCLRTWLETGRGNFCLRCFLVAVGGVAADETGLAGGDCLPADFGLPAAAPSPV